MQTMRVWDFPTPTLSNALLVWYERYRTNAIRPS